MLAFPRYAITFDSDRVVSATLNVIMFRNVRKSTYYGSAKFYGAFLQAFSRGENFSCAKILYKVTRERGRGSEYYTRLIIRGYCE